MTTPQDVAGLAARMDLDQFEGHTRGPWSPMAVRRGRAGVAQRFRRMILMSLRVVGVCYNRDIYSLLGDDFEAH